MRQMHRQNLQGQQRMPITQRVQTSNRRDRERANPDLKLPPTAPTVPEKSQLDLDQANQEQDQELLQLMRMDLQDDLRQGLQDRNQRLVRQTLELRPILNSGPPLT